MDQVESLLSQVPSDSLDAQAAKVVVSFLGDRATAATDRTRHTWRGLRGGRRWRDDGHADGRLRRVGGDDALAGAQAGVISLPVVSAAVRIHAGQVMMAQSHDELPKGVRDALGDGPEVRAMRVTGKAGAGMAEPPEHHVLPREFREWFERRGFTGEMSIDQFCVKLEQAKHEALHGGGNWRLGRVWPGEWNRMIMRVLQKAETRAGRMLTPSEV